MPLRRNRFTGFMVLLFSFALVSLVVAVFFSLKLRQNESFQTQLHLRELQRIATSLEHSIASIRQSIDVDIKTSSDPGDPNEPRGSAESGCSIPHEYCRLKDHLITAFPNLVAETHDNNAEKNSKIGGVAEKCSRQNKSLAIVAGTAGACAVNQRATLISRNFHDQPPNSSANTSTKEERNADDNDNGDRSKSPLASRYIARIKIPLDDLANASSLIPMVILTDQKGHRIHTWENVRNHATQSSIRYRSAAALLQQLKLKQSGVRTAADASETGDDNGVAVNTIGYSDFVDLEIAGERYRAYVMPWRNIPHFAADDTAEQTGEQPSNYYLIGLQPYSSLLGNKLSVSQSIVVLLVLATLIFVTLLPLIKLQLVSPQQAFTPADRQSMVYGSLLFAALLVLSGYHYILYSGLKDQLNTQANNIHRQISSRFKKEVETWRELAEKEAMYQESNLPEYRRCEDGPDFLLSPQVFGSDTFVEGTFILKQEGTFDEGSWSHKRHCRSNDKVVLTHRSYYKHGMNCTGWRIGDDTARDAASECRGKYHIERVLNVRDSRLNTWLSLPLFDTPYNAGASADNDRNLLVFGGRLQTFLKPILPQYFSYLVFDNKTGTVQYHSNDQASSLVDNIFVDTDNNSYLTSLIDLNHAMPQTFNGLYKGQEYLFSAGRIIQTVPWTLLVMYEKAAFRNINMLSVFSTLLLVLGLLTLAWILCLLLPVLLSMLLPGDWRYRLFQPIKFDRSRSTRDYLVVAALLLLLSCLTLVLFFRYYHPGISLLGLAAPILPPLAWLWRQRRQSNQQSSQPSSAQATESEARSASAMHPQRRPDREPSEFKSMAYTLYILLLLVNTVVLPALVVSEQSYRFFLNQHIALMSFDITTKINEAKREQRHYIDSFIDPDDEDLQDAAEHFRRVDLLRCHLGDKQDAEDHLAPRCGSDQGFKTEAFSYTDEEVQMSSRIPTTTKDTNIVEMLWRRMNLKLEATSDFEVLAQKTPPTVNNSETTDTFYRFNPNLPKLYKAIWEDSHLLILVTALLTILLPYWLLRTRVLPNLFGLQFPDNFRSKLAGQRETADNGEPSSNSRHMAAALLRMLDNYRRSDQEPVYIQVIRPGTQTRALFFDVEAIPGSAQPSTGAAPAGHRENLRLEDLSLLTQRPLDLNAITADPFYSPREVLEPQLNHAWPTNNPTLALCGLEHIPLNPVKRKRALQILQYLVAQRSINLFLLADVSPLYRFTHPEAYPYQLAPEVLPDSAEQIAWAALFRRFTKIYDWVPALQPDSTGATSWHAFVREHQGWPELQRVAREFLAYHCAEKDSDYPLDQALRELKQMTDGSCNHADEARSDSGAPDHSHSSCTALAWSIDHYWTPDQVVDFFGTAAVAHYRYRWELCTIQERLLLIQLAHDNTPNPRNIVPIQHLLRRGYLYHQEGWRLVNDSFRNFILHAEDPAIVRRWIGDANESIWKYVRIPIFIVLVSLLALLAYSATEAFQSFMGIAAAVLGLVPLLLRNISLIRSQPSVDG